ncbi:TPM domain-containing protein [Paenibacillus thiaminolyticus]|uniref:TPM domain-containing protein n=1 Tax=Paenibacillus thiaminolyticus TaxID=49283 RepID=UPI00232B2555|nr:TPM domain-containing protein [Paenibacillus thiaminolyticus]WCF09892.1 TPM domain-containing protein [Paenibacillus thiaminolyticus]
MQYALRIVMLLLVIMMSAAPGTARAEGIPAKDGLVQDTAQMLSKKSIASIEKAAKGKLYTFYLLTVDSLNGKAPATYANDVYDQWELGADDILLLISKQERRVEMNFNNPSLQAAIDAKVGIRGDAAGSLTSWLDTHFIPQAKEGDFAAASVSVMKATHALKPQTSAGSKPAAKPGAKADGAAQAGGNSAKAALVQDKARMITKEALPSVKKAAQGKLYTFRLVTVDSFKGAAPEEYANKLYQELGLGSDDILLLLSKKERRVEMNFNNPALQDQIDAETGIRGDVPGSLKAWLDAHFIPKAKEGDFAAASIALMKATHALKPLTPAAGTKEPDAAKQDGPMQEPPPTRRGNTSALPLAIDWQLVLLCAGGLLVLAVAGERGELWIRLRLLLRRQPAMMVRVNQALEKNKTYLDLSQGETQHAARTADRELADILIWLSARQQELETIPKRQWLMPALRKQVAGAAAELKERTADAERLVAVIDHIEALDRTLKQTIADAEERLLAADRDIAAEIQARGWPLDELQRRYHAVKAELAESKQLEIFDPLGAEHRVVHANEELRRLENDVASIAELAEIYRRTPQQMAESRERVRSIAQEFRLKLLRIDPYGNIEESGQVNEQMHERLRHGDIPAAIQRVELMRQLLADAVNMTQRQADLQVKNVSDIAQIKSRLEGYRRRDQDLSEVTMRVQATYRTKHWEQLWHLYRDKYQYLSDIAPALGQAEYWSGIDVQEYDTAREALDRMLMQLAELDRAIERYERQIRDLDSAHQEALRKQAAGETAFATAQRILARQHLAQLWGLQEHRLERLQSGLRNLVADPPYDVDLMNELSGEFADEANEYLGVIERAAVQKRNAERELDRAASQYRRAYSRARRKINVSPFDSRFTSIHREASDLMRRGAYDEATRTISALSGIIGAMESAYNDVLQEERREEEARRAEARRREEARRAEARSREEAKREEERRREEAKRAQQRRSSNSSGGSSWGSGSSSSGGSSWNKNKNSSGGSNW